MKLVVQRVTPDIAAEWLARPWIRQRRINAATVRKYANTMGDGRWEEPSLDPIAFTSDGSLGNGQHRLSAVIASGWRGDMLVAHDVPERNFLVADTGRRRGAAQFVRIPQAALVTATARVVIWYDTDHPASMRSAPQLAYDNDVVLSFIDANEHLLSECVKAAELAYRASRVPAAVGAAVTFIAHRDGADAEIVASWQDGLISGADLQKDDPRLLLREYFVRYPHHAKSRDIQWSAVARSYNAFANGQAMTKLQPNRGNMVLPVVQTVGRRQSVKIRRERLAVMG